MKTKRAVLLGVVFLLIVSLMLSPGCTKETETETPTTMPTEPETVAFSDENLEAAIRERLGKTSGEEIMAAELATLNVFAANGRGIANLSGIQHFSNLTELHLHENQINDISPLSNMTKLTYVGFNNNQISDISPLAFLTNLTELHLADNQISDVSHLSNLTSLTFLHLGGNQISDISPLVENSGLNDGDVVCPNENPLSTSSLDVYIPQLEERGVEINWGCP